MARRRFGRIKESPRLATAYDAFKLWQDRVDPYTPRPAGSQPGGFVKVAVTPFGLAATTKIRVGASRRARTMMSDEIGARAVTDLTGAITFPSYSPAKIVLFAGTGTSTEKRSEITNLTYQKRNGASYVHPFGGATATEREYEAFEAVAENFLSINPNNRVSYQPERIYQV